MALEIQPRIVDDVVILDMTGRLWVLDRGLHNRMQSLLAEGRRFFMGLSRAQLKFL